MANTPVQLLHTDSCHASCRCLLLVQHVSSAARIVSLLASRIVSMSAAVVAYNASVAAAAAAAAASTTASTGFTAFVLRTASVPADVPANVSTVVPDTMLFCCFCCCFACNICACGCTWCCCCSSSVFVCSCCYYCLCTVCATWVKRWYFDMPSKQLCLVRLSPTSCWLTHVQSFDCPHSPRCTALLHIFALCLSTVCSFGRTK